jgi:hypothetical protein
MATKTDGTAWYWGYDKFSSGTQGTDSVANNVNSPVQVGTDTDWEFIVAEPYGAIWKKTDGTFYGTGGGYFIGGTVYLFGSIGQNELVSSPVQLGYIGTNTSILEENVTIAGNLSMVVLKD